MRFAMMMTVLIGCGGGGSGLDPNLKVVDLETDDQVTLCEAFLDGICGSGDPLFDDFCDDPCTSTACQAAADGGNVDEECPTPIDVGDVDDCADAANASTCMQGGGCMFDALEAACQN